MWVLVVLFVVAAMIDDGRPAAIMVSLVGVGLLLAVMGNLVGMIWPWPKGREWQDADAEPCWSYLVHARREAEAWALNAWGSRGWARLSGYVGLFLALFSAGSAILFVAESAFPWAVWPGTFLSWLLDVELAFSFALFLVSLKPGVFGKKEIPEQIVRERLHGEMVLVGQWRLLCGSVPLPFSLWRYIRLTIPVAGWVYHYFFMDGTLMALTAVMGVAMAYFGYVMVDVSFDLLAAANGVEVCPCRSPYLARMVWEAQFLSQKHKPLWARFFSSVGF